MGFRFRIFLAALAFLQPILATASCVDDFVAIQAAARRRSEEIQLMQGLRLDLESLRQGAQTRLESAKETLMTLMKRGELLDTTVLSLADIVSDNSLPSIIRIRAKRAWRSGQGLPSANATLFEGKIYAIPPNITQSAEITKLVCVKQLGVDEETLAVRYLARLKENPDDGFAKAMLEDLPANVVKFAAEALMSKIPVLVFYTQPGCPHCAATEPAVAEMEKDFAGKLTVVRVKAIQDNVNLLRDLEGFPNLGFPRLRVYSGGKVLENLRGAKTAAEIKDAVAPHLPK